MCIGVLLALSTSYASEVQRWDFATYKSHMDNASSSDRFLIAFTATWCGHCKRLKPTFRSLAKTLERKVTVVDIEAPDEKALASLFNIEGFPQIFLITVRQIMGRLLVKLSAFNMYVLFVNRIGKFVSTKEAEVMMISHDFARKATRMSSLCRLYGHHLAL